MVVTVAVRCLPKDCQQRHIEYAVGRLAAKCNCTLSFGPIVDVPFLRGNGVEYRSTTITVSGSNKKQFVNGLQGLAVSSETMVQHIEVDDQFFGVTPLAENSPSDIDIYCLHGLGGHAFESWASPSTPSNPDSVKVWPRDFLPDSCRRAGISPRVSTIGYNANVARNVDVTATIRNQADNLLSQLLSTRPKDTPASKRPMYIICHSLGGLVLCEMLILVLSGRFPEYHEKYKHVLISDGNECYLKGIVFLGTPFRGSMKANQITPFISALSEINPFAMNVSLVRELRNIRDGTGDLQDISMNANIIITTWNIEVLVGCETQPVPSTGRGLVIARESAIGIFGNRVNPITINGHHREMARFATRDNDYRVLESRLIDMIKEATRNVGSLPNRPASDEPPHTLFPSPAQIEADRSLGPPNRSFTVPHYRNQSNQNVYLNFTLPHGYSPPVPEHGSPDSGHSGMQSFMPPLYTNSGTTLSALHTAQSSSPPACASQEAITQSLQPPSRASTTPVAKKPEIDDHTAFSLLAKFDTIFILDNTGSMQQLANSHDSSDVPRSRWNLLEEGMKVLVDKAIHYDTDGVDIYFLKLPEELNAEGVANPRIGGGTFFTEALELAIEPRMTLYRNFVKDRADGKNPRRPKPLNLIAITDGEADDRVEVEEYLRDDIAAQLDQWNAPKSYIGIQFVQVGDDQQAAKWLRELDDDLAKEPDSTLRDMIDTTPYRGSDPRAFTAEAFNDLLVKILLGAVRKELDRKNNSQFLPQE